MRTLSTLILAALAVIGITASANATPTTFPIVWTFDHVTFTDGGTVSGSFSINQYGFFQTFDLTTTTNGGFPGAHYTTALNASINNPGDTLTIFNRLLPTAYDGFLQLTFQNSLFTPSNGDPIVLGSTKSFECLGFQQLDGSCLATQRNVTGGDVYVPEPSTIALFGVALFGLGMLRRRA